MSNLEFTVYTHGTSRCDGCGLSVSHGFLALHNGTPVLFDCVSCAPSLYKQDALDAAIEEHREAIFDRAARADETDIDAVICEWVRSAEEVAC
jgi:hypothetical protein